MKAHYFQHVPFEGLGSIADWLSQRGHQIDCTRFYAEERLPDPDKPDFLVIMGGPMSVNDEVTYPWLISEKQFIRQFIAAGKPVLGICLGAQLIASAMGARVYPSPRKEIGWHHIESTECADPPLFGNRETVFQWHGETFDLPEGARHLARSEVCENQAFALGDRVIGLQFHLETTPESAALLVSHCGEELVAGPTIQSARQIVSANPQLYGQLNRRMADILCYLAP
jgi:GMP synthase-like glutamine amidotransferase